jgi:hypothetical protein
MEIKALNKRVIAATANINNNVFFEGRGNLVKKLDKLFI